MERNQLNEIEKRLEKLTRIELEYFRNWLMDHYPILGMAHDIGTIIDTMDGVGSEYKDVDNMLNHIHDHNQWEIEESYFVEEEKSGYYIILDTQEIMENLSVKSWNIFVNILIEKYPIYNTIKSVDLFSINDSLGKDGFPKWIEIFEMLKNIKLLNRE
jgi:hypothetical protein